MAGLLASVDVGTGSARAAIIDAEGRMLARAERPIALRAPLPDHAEQDSGEIWDAACAALRAARAEAGANPADVVGISFDATCSLVVRDPEGRAVSVAGGGEDRWDTVVWLDHRAKAEAEECTASGHRVLDYMGGVMSPEMAIPKLMWLKRHLPETWARAGLIFDLTDFMTWKASGTPRPLAVHADLQMDLSRPRAPRLAGGFPRRHGPRRPGPSRRPPRTRQPDRHRPRPADAARRRRSSA